MHFYNFVRLYMTRCEMCHESSIDGAVNKKQDNKIYSTLQFCAEK